MVYARDLPNVILQPGELYLARTPMVLETILGSCVGVTFWSAGVGAGALCHGVLPHWRGGMDTGLNSTMPEREMHRYIDLSIRCLIRQFDALGARRAEVQVKLFGGADVLAGIAERKGVPTVGAQNCRAALEVLAEEGLRVVASDLRGKRGRRIHFNTETGEVIVRRLGSCNGKAA